jgi:hypothetical protein
MTNPSATIEAIYRYPVKGLSPQAMDHVTLSPRATLPADRLYAIENGPSGYNPAAPKFIPKQRFLVLMRNERLATLRTDYDEASHTLVINEDGHEAARGDLRSPEGRAAIEAFFKGFMPDELRGAPRVLFGDQHSFSDVGAKVVSLSILRRLRPLPEKPRRRSTPCVFAPTSMFRAGRPGTSST